MAKKDPAKPLFEVKNDFVDSLAQASQEAIMLHQALKMALDRDMIPGEVGKVLKERHAAFAAAFGLGVE